MSSPNSVSFCMRILYGACARRNNILVVNVLCFFFDESNAFGPDSNYRFDFFDLTLIRKFSNLISHLTLQESFVFTASVIRL